MTTHLQFPLFSRKGLVWKEPFGFLSSTHPSAVEEVRKERLRHVWTLTLLAFSFGAHGELCLPLQDVVDTLTEMTSLPCNKVSPIHREVVEVKLCFQVKAPILSTIMWTSQ